MTGDIAPVVRLADYRPTPYAIDQVDLDFSLHPAATLVTSKLTIRRREGTAANTPLDLVGDGLSLNTIWIDGNDLDAGMYEAGPDRLLIADPPADPFTLEIATTVNPDANGALMGLYRSGGVYTTQCEAEGFRRITYFYDRPDVLSVYSVRLEADRNDTPILLSNGNCTAAGPVPDSSRHYAIWRDPHPKPSYLFALVGGDLARINDRFTTGSGRDVALAIYCEHGKEARCAYAMEALKRAMAWDEERFGREYDLDVFNIVAVADFNMGAMENKGLNIFNDKFILADPDTATDQDYAHIETIIAHEYFHNWTGNRITCRDWFQLCLKEGLTVFRDHEFSADMRSRPVRRIAEVTGLRQQQFPEDSGPLAHPVRPETYREINNFYTATVYEKGSEVCRMLQTILGVEGFSAGMDLYFQRHDGEATTIEHFLACFSDATGADLRQFARWYHQAGTPRVSVKSAYDPHSRQFVVDLAQSTPATPGQNEKLPFHIPIAFGLVGPDGQDLSYSAIAGDGISNDVGRRDVIHLKDNQARIVFEDVPAPPVPSLLRGFSAPVILETDQGVEERLFLIGHDRDPFNRWGCAQRVALDMLVAATRSVNAEESIDFDPRYEAAIGRLLDDEGLEPAFRARALELPSETDIAQSIGRDIDPDAVHSARIALKTRLGKALGGRALEIVAAFGEPAAYFPDADQSGRRALARTSLDLAFAGGHATEKDLREAYSSARNLTERHGALAIAVLGRAEVAEGLLGEFRDRYDGNPLVLDKWLSLQAMAPGADTLEAVETLQTDPVFSLKTPNRVYSLLRTFGAANPTGFHRLDGKGHRFLADVIARLDPINPSVAARLTTCFGSCRMLEPVRRASAKDALAGLQNTANLSTDVADLVDRILAG